MNEKYKPLYLFLTLCGVCMLAASALPVSEQVGGMLCGAGCGLAAMGGSLLLQLRRLERDPELRRKSEIAGSDERNIAIRRRAQAVSGEA